jgi:hypothetical protein
VRNSPAHHASRVKGGQDPSSRPAAEEGTQGKKTAVALAMAVFVAIL